VLVDGDHIEPVLAECLEDRLYFIGEHRDVAGNGGIRIGAHKRGPGVQAHAGVDRRAHVLDRKVVTADRDLVEENDAREFVFGCRRRRLGFYLNRLRTLQDARDQIR
jgi:hypothetical protein